MPRFEPGDHVILDGQHLGTVNRVLADRSPIEYEVFLSAVATPVVPEYRLSPAEEGPLPPDHQPWEAPLLPLGQFRMALTHRRLTGRLSDTLLAYGAARIQILPHQFKPLLRLLDSPYRRLLIADEVGLGKTVEAGLILSEYELREEVERVLVLCPNALLHKWRDELEAKFGMSFVIWNRQRVGDWLSRHEAGAPPDTWRAIVSMDTMADAQLVERLSAAAPRLDFLIVDEAHHLRNESTYAYRTGEILADGSRIVLFLSATPLHLAQRDLYNLLHLLLPSNFTSEAAFASQLEPNGVMNGAIRLLRDGVANQQIRDLLLTVHRTSLSDAFARSAQFNAMVDRLADPAGLSRDERVGMQRVCLDMNTLGGVLTRTRKADVAAFTTRAPQSLIIPFTTAEHAFYDAVTAFAMARSDARGGLPFGAQVYQRQVCSSTAAMRALLVGLHIAAERAEELLEDEDESVGGEEQGGYAPRTAEERRLLDTAVQLGRALGSVDSKRECLDDLLARLVGHGHVQRALIFSYFRRTLDYLEVHLSRRYRVGVIRGGMPLDDRARVVRKFRNGEIDIMLSSEVGGEGLDFQFCNLLINYDLPWNPMEVEQRIGRLDRFGQKHDKILIYNLLVEETVEERIFGRLYERIGIFQAAVGDMGEILGDAVRELTQAALNPTLSEAQQERRAEQLANQLIHNREDWNRVASGRQSLVGSDQYLLDRFAAVQQTRAHISSAELRSYVDEGLRRGFPGSQLGAGSEARHLVVDGDFVRVLEFEVYGKGADGRLRGNDTIRPLLRAKASVGNGAPIPVTFDPAVAFESPDVELLGPRHPYVRAIASRNERDDISAVRCAFLSGSTSAELASGRHLLAIHQVTADGLLPLRRLEVIAASLDSGQITKLTPGWLVTFLESARDLAGKAEPPSHDALRKARYFLDQRMTELAEAELEALAVRQADLLELRQGVLRAEAIRKQRRIEVMLETLQDAKIRRLRTRELRNLMARCEDECTKLADAAAVNVSWSALSYAVLTIG